MKKIVLAGLVFFIIVSVNSSFAKMVPIGEVSFLRGDARRIPRGTIKEYKLNLGDKISSGDRILTKRSTIVKVQMIDDSVMTFGPMTEFTFRKFYLSEKKQKRMATYELLMGKLRAKFAKREGVNNIEIKTKAASMGVRGTELLVNSEKAGKKGHITQVALLTGKVEVTNLKDLTKIVLTPGKTIVTMVDPGMSKPKTKVFDLAGVKQQALASASLPAQMKEAGDGEINVGSSMDGEKEKSVGELESELFLEDIKSSDMLK